MGHYRSEMGFGDEDARRFALDEEQRRKELLVQVKAILKNKKLPELLTEMIAEKGSATPAALTRLSASPKKRISRK